jgi:hypothetical protein
MAMTVNAPSVGAGQSGNLAPGAITVIQLATAPPPRTTATALQAADQAAVRAETSTYDRPLSVEVHWAVARA